MTKAVANQVRVWDIPTRVFHWMLAVNFVFLIISGDQGWMEWHFKAGYLMSSLVVFRVVWGFLGSRYARFQSFVFSPSKTIAYVKATFSGEHEHHYGHNPAGALMVFGLLLLLFVQTLSGMVISDDIFWEGPFYNSVPEYVNELGGAIHEPLQGLLQAFVVLHILAIIFHKVKFKESLVPAMVHGKKPVAVTAEPRESVSVLKLVVATTIALVWLGYLISIPI